MQNIIRRLKVNSLLHHDIPGKEQTDYFKNLTLPLGKQISSIEVLYIFIDAETHHDTQQLVNDLFQREFIMYRNQKALMKESEALQKYLGSLQEKMTNCAVYDRELTIMVFLGMLFLLSQEIFTKDLEIKQQQSYSQKARNQIKLSLSIKLCKELERVTRYGLPFKIADFQYNSYIELLTPFYLAERECSNYFTVYRDYLGIAKPLWSWRRYRQVQDAILKSAKRPGTIGGIALNKEMLAFQEINKTVSKRFKDFAPETVNALLPKILQDMDCMAELLGPPSSGLKKSSHKLLYLPSDFEVSDSETLIREVISEYGQYCKNFPLPAFHDQAFRAELLHHVAKRFQILTYLDGMESVEGYAKKQLIYMPGPPFLYDSSSPDKNRFYKEIEKKISKPLQETDAVLPGLKTEPVETEDLKEPAAEEVAEREIPFDENGEFTEPGMVMEPVKENNSLLNHEFEDNAYEDKGLLTSRSSFVNDDPLSLADEDMPDSGLSEERRELEPSGAAAAFASPAGTSTLRKPIQITPPPASSIRKPVTAAQNLPVKSLPVLLLEGKIDVQEYFIRTAEEEKLQESHPRKRKPQLILVEGEVFAKEVEGSIVPAHPEEGTIKFILRDNELSIQIKENNEWFLAYSLIKITKSPFSGKLSHSYSPADQEQNDENARLKDYLFQIQTVDDEICVFFD